MSKGQAYGFSREDIKFIRRLIHVIREAARTSIDSNISTRSIVSFLDTKHIFGNVIAEAALVNQFEEHDQALIEEKIKFAKAESNTVNISEKEMEGLDLSKFAPLRPADMQRPAKADPKLTQLSNELPF
jgi:hypothetical protein